VNPDTVAAGLGVGVKAPDKPVRRER